MNIEENEWDLSAKDYSEHVLRFFTHRRITNLLAASCDFRPKTILDFGCGPGNSTEFLSFLFPDTKLVIGVDSSREMLNEASKVTARENIEYLLDDERLKNIQDKIEIDAIFLSNSFFHLEKKSILLDNLKKHLNKDSYIYFSMYESVFHPENKITWSYESHEHDSLMSDAIRIINKRGFNYEDREEDKEIFSEHTLLDLFETNGYDLQLSGIINLVRGKDERLNFLKIPAVSREVFPNIPQEVINDAMNELQFNNYRNQQRKIYSFSAKLK